MSDGDVLLTTPVPYDSSSMIDADAVSQGSIGCTGATFVAGPYLPIQATLLTSGEQLEVNRSFGSIVGQCLERANAIDCSIHKFIVLGVAPWDDPKLLIDNNQFHGVCPDSRASHLLSGAVNCGKGSVCTWMRTDLCRLPGTVPTPRLDDQIFTFRHFLLRDQIAETFS